MTGAKRRGKAASRRPVKERAPDAVADEIRRVIERNGAFPKADVLERAGSKAGALAVFDRLAEGGFEIGSKSLRRPLEEQLESHVKEHGPIALSDLATTLSGATTAETKGAARALVDRGRMQLVMRGADLAIAERKTSVLDTRTLERLATAATALAKAARAASKKGVSLLRADVDRELAPFLPRPASAASGPATPKGAANGTGAAATRNIAALVEQYREPSGLTSVPKLVRLLGGDSVREALHAELLRGARAGRFELRPESGMGRLSAEDVSFCIPGPQGSRLSWVRRIEE